MCLWEDVAEVMEYMDDVEHEIEPECDMNDDPYTKEIRSRRKNRAHEILKHLFESICFWKDIEEVVEFIEDQHDKSTIIHGSYCQQPQNEMDICSKKMLISNSKKISKNKIKSICNYSNNEDLIIRNDLDLFFRSVGCIFITYITSSTLNNLCYHFL